MTISIEERKNRKLDELRREFNDVLEEIDRFNGGHDYLEMLCEKQQNNEKVDMRLRELNASKAAKKYDEQIERRDRLCMEIMKLEGKTEDPFYKRLKRKYG